MQSMCYIGLDIHKKTVSLLREGCYRCLFESAPRACETGCD